MTTKIVLIVEYDGTHYFGFQWQSNLPTIQDELEKAIERFTGEKVRVMSASRTDTGVHAIGQTVSFRTGSAHSTRTIVNALNFHLPEDIAVKAAYKVDESVNVRRSALSREYRYYMLNSDTRSPVKDRYSFQVRDTLDIDLMNQACQLLIGKHNFASFLTAMSPSVKSTVRNVLKAEVTKKDEMVIFEIIANSFLPHQVRNTVGALIRVGLGRMTVEEFYSIMKAEKIGLAGPAAPARGLFLTRVNYSRPWGD